MEYRQFVTYDPQTFAYSIISTYEVMQAPKLHSQFVQIAYSVVCADAKEPSCCMLSFTSQSCTVTCAHTVSQTLRMQHTHAYSTLQWSMHAPVLTWLSCCLASLVCSYSARQLLMSFHNAVNGSSIPLEGTADTEICSHLNSAASVLLGKTKVLRRQRLPLIFDLYAWVTFQGALTHMMITIPYWLRYRANWE